MRLKIFSIDVLCFFSFILLVGIFFWQTIVFGKLPVPSDSLVGLYHPWRDLYAATNPRGVPFKNFLITDPVRQQIPWRIQAIGELKKERLPGWNPYNFSGMPQLANIQSGALYPLNLIFFVFNFSVGWTILIILEPLLAGLFLYGYLRNQSLSPFSSLVGAISWAFGGFAIAWLTWGTIMHVALWLPLGLFAIDKIFTRNKSPNTTRLATILLAFVLIAQFFAGHAQMSFYFFVCVIAYAVWRVTYIREIAGPAISVRNIFEKVALIGSAIFIFVLVTSVQWRPIVELLMQTTRLSRSEPWLEEGWFIPWQHAVQFFSPDFFGNPTTLNYWGTWNYGEMIGYIGILPLIFAGYSLRGFRDKHVLFWIIIVAGCLLFAFPTPLAYIPFKAHLPLVASLQPTRLMMIIDFGLAVLAAYGAEYWKEKKGKKLWYIIGLVGLTFLVLWIVVLKGAGEPLRANFEVSRRNLTLPSLLFLANIALIVLWQIAEKKKSLTVAVLFFLLLVLSIDVLRFGWKFTPFTPQSYFFPSTATIKFLQSQEKPFRIMTLDSRVFPANANAYFGIESVDGYDPLYPSQYSAFVAASERGAEGEKQKEQYRRIISFSNIHSKIMPLLNVKYILTLADVTDPALRKVFQEGETRVYEVTNFLPRMFFAATLIPVTNQDAALSRISESVFDPELSTVVEGQLEQKDFGKAKDDTVRIASYETQKISLETVTKSKRFLVVGNTYYPGWHGRIDGQSAPLFRTNFMFQGLIVPAGTHNIEIAFN